MWKLIKAFLCLGMGVSYGEDDDAEARRTMKVRELQRAERERQQRILEEESGQSDSQAGV
jgi:hypothetical protein